LSAFKQLYPHALWLMFGKTTPPDPDPIKLLGGSSKRKEAKAPDIHHILIVDDVFATGATAARIVAFLKQKSLPTDVCFHIAAPLLIPASFMQKTEQDKILPSDLPPLE
jgi:adenine/guanine phosphoribosyltransferase-like PRPP-binding protein